MEVQSARIVNRSAPSKVAQRQVAPAAVTQKATQAAGPRPAASIQLAAKVSSPGDPAEKEAEQTARKIMRMADPTVQRAVPPGIQRFVGSTLSRSSAEASTPTVTPAISSEISAASGSGSALSGSVRSFMEPRFQADFGAVRIHTDERASRLSQDLGARAFTVGNHVFFSSGAYQPESSGGKELLAHELTHTIQQGAAVQRAVADPIRESAPPMAQRLGISDALNYFADAANNIPGYRMFTIVLGVNPINMSAVDRSAANILRAVVEFMPGGGLIVTALDNYGVFDRAGAFVETQLRSLGITGSAIRAALNRFLDSLSWRDIFRLGSVWDRAKRIFSEPVERIKSFVRGLASAVLTMIKDAILRPLAGLASRTRGWDLLCAVLGRNPITGDAVPRNAETLIGGFMTLIGQQEVWQNIQRGNAIGRAWAWFQGAMGAVLGFVREIPSLFIRALQSFQISDIVQLPTAFSRVAGIFGDFIGRFISWAGGTVMDLLEIIFSVVAPGVMVYIRRAAGALRTIIQDPIRFVGNLVRAGATGLRQFASNFLRHLRASLIGWLTGAMSGAGLYIPQAFNLREILKFVLSVLGLTWQNIRTKLVRAIGETAVRALETGFEIVQTLVTQGPAAAWQQILEGISNLQQLVIDGVMNFVRDRIIQAAITRLVSMLNPAGAFIQAIIATYNTVMFFVERLRQIMQVAMAFIDSIAAIASGNISAAANRVEQVMAGLLTLVISFLARIAGLGRVSDAVTNIINRVRAPIDRALDRVVDWIVAQARRLGRLAAQGAQSALGWMMEYRRRRALNSGRERHSTWIDENGALMVATTPVRARVALNTLRDRLNAMPAAGRPPTAAAKLADADTAVGAVEALITNPATAQGGAAPPALRAAWDAFIVKLSAAYAVFTAEGQMAPFGPLAFTFTTSRYTGSAKTSLESSFRVQLRDQQNGINALKAGEWAANRARYVEVGRSGTDRSNLAEYRELLRSESIRIRTNIGKAQGLSEAAARTQAETWVNQFMSRHAVLHVPDQVAGGPLLFPDGKPTSVNGLEVRLGLRGANSAIGGGWAGKSAELAQLETLARTADPLTRMNVVLSPVFA